jgi:hypothetical protein
MLPGSKRITQHKLDGWHEISPAGAIEILEGRIKNRNLSEHVAEFYANSMKNNHWRKNGEPLIFDERCRLLDGQHRLRACILANLPFTSYCIFGVEASAFDTMDQGKTRGASDIATIRNMKNASLVAAIAKLAISSKEGAEAVYSGNKLPNYEVNSYLSRHVAELEAAATFINKYRSKLTSVVNITAALSGFVFYTARRQDEKLAMEFIEKLATGVGLEKGSPILALRNRLQSPLKGKSNANMGITKTALYGYTIKGWCLFRDGSSGVLRLVDGERVTMYTSFK